MLIYLLYACKTVGVVLVPIQWIRGANPLVETLRKSTVDVSTDVTHLPGNGTGNDRSCRGPYLYPTFSHS